jgi:cysteine desulfurase/selenocysteine lyase
MDAEQIKQDFPILNRKSGEERVVYLDNAATTQKPEQVIQRIQKFYREENSNEGRGLYNLATKATKAYKQSRKTVANFVGADADELIFTRNTTESLNLLAHALNIDGKILIPELAHHSEQLPWREKAGREGLEIEFIPTKNHKTDIDALEEMIDDETALVSISQVSNVFGTKAPIKEVAEIAHEHNAYLVVDGAQSVPNMPVDVKELECDFLAFSSHKMVGPTGMGGLYVKREHFKQMDPYQVGGGMIKAVEKENIRYGDGAEAFEAGTPNISGAVGIAEAVKYLENIGMSNIREHEVELAQKAIRELETLEDITVYATEDSSLVSFTSEYAHPHDVAEILNQHNVCVRAGHHCAQPQMESMDIQGGTVRASPYIYNTKEDIERLVEAVKEVKEVFGP